MPATSDALQHARFTLHAVDKLCLRMSHQHNITSLAWHASINS